MNTSKTQSISILSKEIVQDIENKNRNKNLIPTGFQYLDDEFSGLSLGELVVVGGRPAMGKSQFVINLVAHVSQTEPVLFFSFDLTSYTFSARLLSNKTGIPVQNIINKALHDSEKESIKKAAQELEQSNLYVSENGLANIEETLTIIREHVAVHDTKIVVIDYLQLLSIGKYNNGREAEVSHICRLLKMCAKELNICLILLSQLSRAVEVRGSSKRPQLSDLRDSGSIEQIADKVWLLYRPEYYMIEELDDEEFTPSDCILMVIVAKNKNGKMGTSYFKRDVPFTRFQSIQKPGEAFTFNVKRLIELEDPNKKDEDDATVPF
ncbi:DnaB-like helicase C-terminal domain-containing protein [Flavobacterium aciduliphilum]|uniref:Replicative DNA helicase n=1 Tax=Flavobacterium aciduliphilum TaxID=1101402 RepID=A0A328YKK8_9FLAO|nr:DnaB-like helicase C-terminal domain-containing protein [Flavobacterium aciduliphilum]RAR73844.1 replicative DNA helicase [Flavobacterium aciduliphilum]